jgi:hypothetical protein
MARLKSEAWQSSGRLSIVDEKEWVGINFYYEVIVVMLPPFLGKSF